MAMLNYQQEIALSKLTQTLVKSSSDYDYFEMLDLFRQLETEGFVSLQKSNLNMNEYIVHKTQKGQSYNFNWLHSEFR